jgi:nicotinamidase-related amidase
LHGSAPDDCAAVLLVIDMISDFQFDRGDKLFASALPAAERIASLAERARGIGIPVVYVNDNAGRWRSSLQEVWQNAASDGCRGRPISLLLEPTDTDYFVLKPKHSGFFGTTLEILLAKLGATRLILTGVAGDACVLMTAVDAYLREYDLFVPSDCIASQDPDENAAALRYMARVVKADTSASTSLDLQAMARG